MSILVLLISTLFISGCVSQPSSIQEEGAPTEEEVMAATDVMPDLGTIKVGYIPILGHVHFFLAQELGYFAEQGLNVELQSFRTGTDMIAPLSLGQLDVGSGESGPALFNAINQDLDVRVVSGAASQPEDHGAVPLLVRYDLIESGKVSDVSALSGRKVAVNVERGMAEYLLAKALEKANLTVDNVEIVTLPFPDMPQALANAAVDAAILPHPLAAITLRLGENGEPPIAGVLLEGDEIADYPQNGVVYYGKQLLDPENHEVGVRIMIALLNAAREVQGEEWRSNDEIINAINKYTNVPPPVIQNSIAFYFDPDGEINKASTEDIQGYQVSRGYTEFSVPLPLNHLIVDTFREDALARLGSFED